MRRNLLSFFFFFFNDTATTEIYTLSLHDALPIYIVGFDSRELDLVLGRAAGRAKHPKSFKTHLWRIQVLKIIFRSEEHTSELQSRSDIVCRLLLEKKKKQQHLIIHRPIPGISHVS